MMHFQPKKPEPAMLATLVQVSRVSYVNEERYAIRVHANGIVESTWALGIDYDPVDYLKPMLVEILPSHAEILEQWLDHPGDVVIGPLWWA